MQIIVNIIMHNVILMSYSLSYIFNLNFLNFISKGCENEKL